MSIDRCARRNAVVAAALAAVAATTVAAPAGAMAAPGTPAGGRTVAAVVDQPFSAQLTGSTPFCLVQAALFYPFFIGTVLFTNPAAIPVLLPAYWTGGGSSEGGGLPGALNLCGVIP